MASDRRRPPAPPPPELLARKSFEGHIERVTFRSEDGAFAVVRFATDGGSFPVRGDLAFVPPGDRIRIVGDWKDHPRHGLAFQANSYTPLDSPTEAGVRAYLSSGVLKGIGPGWAKRLVDTFGADTLKVLTEAPERLMEIPGITRKRAESIAGQWASHRPGQELMLLLLEYGISPRLAARLIKFYGGDAPRILRETPYRVGLEVPLIGFIKADEIAARVGIPRDSPQRLRAGLVHTLTRAADEGHTYLPPEKLVESAVALLGCAADSVERELRAATGAGDLKLETLAGVGEAVFAPSLWASESGVARRVLELLARARPLLESSVDALIADFESRYRFQLAPSQRAALRAVTAGGVCVVTGGPGTGKTTLVRALLHVLSGTNLSMALCAPTGRAAQRLSETTNEAAATIHRLLRFNAHRGDFSHDRTNPLELDLLIVDEASMLDIPLAFHLLNALPDGASVLFVGDVDQLPSVGPGAFLKDLIDSQRARTVRLDVIFRQAQRSAIVQNSHRINQGDMPVFADPQQGEQPSDCFLVVREEPEDVREALLRMVTERIPKRFGFDPLADVQVLAPMRRGVLGTVELNGLLQQRLNPNGAPVVPGLPFRVGDKVIQMVNNYDLDVYNGDVGRIVGVDTETAQVAIRFDARTVHYPPESLDQLQPAYAITIHKSQGSEYPAVVIPIHTTHYIMLRRNLLYTAMTRGRKLVVLIGTWRAIGVAVRNVSEGARLTALRSWLVGGAPTTGQIELA